MNVPISYNGDQIFYGPYAEIEVTPILNVGKCGENIHWVFDTSSIGANAFKYCSSVTSIFIPLSMTFVDQTSFSGWQNNQFTEYDSEYYLGNPSNPYIVLIKAKDFDIMDLKIVINLNMKVLSKQ